MPQAPSISVIVPVYNDARRLDACLAALAAQTYPRDRFEVIVVDNGSSPPLAPAAPDGLTVRLLREGRPGSYVARNRGVEEARGAILAFTDGDCRPAADWLEAAAHRLAQPDARGVIAGRVLVLPRNERPTPAERYDMATGFPVRAFVERHGYGVTANLVVRRDVFDEVGPFDASLRSGGDQEWCVRAGRLGHPVVFGADVVVRHPARGLRGILRKYRRIIGGRRDRAAAGTGARTPARIPAAAPTSGCGPTARPRRPWLDRVWPVRRFREIRDDARSEGVDVGRGVFLVVLAVEWAMLLETLRLRLGGKPLR